MITVMNVAAVQNMSPTLVLNNDLGDQSEPSSGHPQTKKKVWSAYKPMQLFNKYPAFLSPLGLKCNYRERERERKLTN